MSLFSALVGHRLQDCLRTQLAKGCPRRTNREVKSLNLRAIRRRINHPEPYAGAFPRSIPANLWDTVFAMWFCAIRRRKAFSYNKRTMDRAMRPFWPLWQFLESITYVLSTR